jgi:HlyD family secretion protein
VRVKLAAYPFTKYGMLEGRVRNISADATQLQSDKNGRPNDGIAAPNESPFKALIQLSRQDLVARGMTLPIAAGMRVSAEIREGERTVLEYLLSPVQKVAQTAGGER